MARSTSVVFGSPLLAPCARQPCSPHTTTAVASFRIQPTTSFLATGRSLRTSCGTLRSTTPTWFVISSLFGLQHLAYSVLSSAVLALFRVQHPRSNLHPSRLRSSMCRLQLWKGEGEVLRPHLHQHAHRQDHVESSPVGLLVRTM